MKNTILKSLIYILALRCAFLFTGLTGFDYRLFITFTTVFSSLYFLVKSRKDNSWVYICATLAFQGVFCFLTFVVLDKIIELKYKYMLIYTPLENASCALVVTVTLIDTARMGITSLCKHFEKNKCQESYIPKAPDAE